MIWNIIADSSCDLFDLPPIKSGNDEVRFYTVPFVISAEGKDFVDDENIHLGEMLDAIERDSAHSRTSCPNPADWLTYFEKKGCCIAITISKELSGSFNSASTARQMALEEDPTRQIAVINSVSAGAGPLLLVDKLRECIAAGMSFEDTAAAVQKEAYDMRTIFSLCSFHNLVKNGRMSPLVGLLATKLGFWGIGAATNIGTLEVIGKVRGGKKAMQFVLDDIKKRGASLTKVYITHVDNAELAELLAEKVRTELRVPVILRPTRGLCSYYAERHGLIIAFN